MAGYVKTDSEVYQHANYVYGLYDEVRSTVTSVRNLVRHRTIEEAKELEAQAIKPAFSSRPLAIVHQARAFADDSILNYQVFPQDNSIDEDKVTSNLERFLSGVKPELARTVGFPFADGFYNYFETGRGIWKMRFDSARACEGEFPFVVTAVDPYGYARLRGTRGLTFVVEKESKNISVFCDELYGQHGGYDEKGKVVKKRGWQVPASLARMAKDKPNTDVEITYCYDRKHEWCYLSYMSTEDGNTSDSPVVGELLWKREHYMGQVPFVEAFCIPMGSGDRPKEQGVGLAFPILSMLQQENILFSKFANDAEIGSRPLAHMQRADGSVVVEQIYPGYTSERQVKEWKEMVLQQNEVVLDKLTAFAQNDIARMTFPEIAFSGQIMQLSGEAYRQALSGLAAKLKQFMTQPQVAISLMAGMLLERVEYFMTPEMAEVLCPDDTEAYLESCSVALATSRTTGKEKGSLSLTAKDVQGHYRVNVTIEPSLPSDDSAKVDRFATLTGAGLDFATAVREYLQPEHPEQVIEAWEDQQLMEMFPEYKQAKMQKMLVDRLERDPDLGQMFQQVGQQALQAAEQQKALEQQQMMEMQAQQQQQAMMGGGMQQQQQMMPPPQVQPVM
jgi:hypothetical protein